MIKRLIVLSLVISLSVLSLHSQSVGYSTDSVWVKISLHEYQSFKEYKSQPEQLDIVEIIGLGTTAINAIDKVLGCRCAQKLKDELLDIFLCEKFPESTFCDKINSDE